MKKKLFSLMTAICVIALLGVNTQEANAQFSVRGGLAWAGAGTGIGLQVGAEYEIIENLYGEADFEVFFPGSNTSFFDLNVNGQYHFMVAVDELELYPLAGLNVAFISVFGFTSSSIGVNLGGGAQYAVTERLKPFFESKFIIGSGGWSRYAGSLGVKYTFGG